MDVDDMAGHLSRRFPRFRCRRPRRQLALALPVMTFVPVSGRIAAGTWCGTPSTETTYVLTPDGRAVLLGPRPPGALPDLVLHVLDVAETGLLRADPTVGDPGERPQEDADPEETPGDLVDDRVTVHPRTGQEEAEGRCQRRRRPRGPEARLAAVTTQD